MSNTSTANGADKSRPSKVESEVEELRSPSADLAGYVNALFSAIESLAGHPGQAHVVQRLAACGQYVACSLDGSVFTACNEIVQVSKELH